MKLHAAARLKSPVLAKILSKDQFAKAVDKAIKQLAADADPEISYQLSDLVHISYQSKGKYQLMIDGEHVDVDQLDVAAYLPDNLMGLQQLTFKTGAEAAELYEKWATKCMELILKKVSKNMIAGFGIEK